MRGRFALEVMAGRRPVAVALNGIPLLSLPEGGTAEAEVEEWLLPGHNELHVRVAEHPEETGRFALRLAPKSPVADVPTGIVWSRQPAQEAGPLELRLPFPAPEPPLTRLPLVAERLNVDALTESDRAEARDLVSALFGAFAERDLAAVLEAWAFRTEELALAYPDDPPDHTAVLQDFFFREPYELEPLVGLDLRPRFDGLLVEVLRDGVPLLRHAPHRFYEPRAIRVYLARIDGHWVVAR